MATNNIFTKRPDEVLDYMWDWSEWLLSQETIVTATVTTTDTDMTIDSVDASTTSVVIWVSGGNYGKHVFECEIVTSQNRTAIKPMVINVIR